MGGVGRVGTGGLGGGASGRPGFLAGDGFESIEEFPSCGGFWSRQYMSTVVLVVVGVLVFLLCVAVLE